MHLTFEKKKMIVDDLARVAAVAPVAIAAEYAGLTVADMTALRKAARDSGVHIKVVRNTLARWAFENTSFECMRSGMVGPLLLAFASEDEPNQAARVIRDFSKTNEKLLVKLIVLTGQLLDPSDLDRLADMPSLEEARAILLGVLQAPLNQFLRTLAEPQARFVRLLSEYHKRHYSE